LCAGKRQYNAAIQHYDQTIRLRRDWAEPFAARGAAAADTGGHRKRQHLGYRPRVNPKTSRRFPLAQTFNLNRKTNSSVHLRTLHPSALPFSDKGHVLSDFYSGAIGLPVASVTDFCSGDFTLAARSAKVLHRQILHQKVAVAVGLG
jgi:hypothetical protein